MTQDQLLASDPNRSVWVSASAGTGKTKVLTDRVLRLLLTGIDPGSILCVTFTKAAAAEMLERIERQLGEWAVMPDHLLEASLKALMGEVPAQAMQIRARQLFARVLDAPQPLKVQTIHSFCQSVISRFPLEAGISPHVKLLDDRDAEEMLNEARLRLYTDSYNDAESGLGKALRILAQSISEKTLSELIERIISERRKFAYWLEVPGGVERFSALLHEGLGVPPHMTEGKLIQKHFAYTAEEESALRSVIAILTQNGGKNNAATAKAISHWLERRDNAVEYAESYFTEKGTLRASLYTKSVAEKNPFVTEVIGKEAERVSLFLSHYKTLRILQSSCHMMAVANALLSHYRNEKIMRGVIDYDDIILHTMQLLLRSGAAAWVLFKLDSTIDHLLVDEAQDTSPEQWKIVEALVGEFFSGEGARAANRTLFVVGDEKQSIFSFQGAEPIIFDAMRMTLKKRAAEAEKLFSHVRLDISFRSTEAVLSAVDTVFATAEARDGLVFSESDLSHKAHRSQQPGRVELWPLIEGERCERRNVWDASPDALYAPSPEQRMAESIAKEISGWLATGRKLPAHDRPVRPGDIMILVQRRGDFNEAMLRALKRSGIPVAGADRLVITDHIAVMDCMALGDFLLLPQDDLTLAALLKSPFVGMHENDLFKLAHARNKHSLWQCLRANPAYKPQADFLSGLLAMADYVPPYELFTHVLVTLGKHKAIAERLGKEADDPLHEFLNLALLYERTHPPSMQGFLHWLRSSETDIKRDMEKGRDEVRILTVHASKGLQAPIVFLPDTTRVPRPSGNLQWLKTEPPMPLWSEAKECDDTHMDALKDASRADSYREYRRLLYVAMTRAEDELYICGWRGEREASRGCWYDLIKNAVDGNEAWCTVGDRKLLLNTGTALANVKKYVSGGNSLPTPQWANQPAPPEPSPTKPLSPSRMAADAVPALQLQAGAFARARGVLVHRLLQYLPDTVPEARGAVMERFIERYGSELSLWEREEVARQVTAVLEHPEFSPVFSEHSIAEAPIVGVVNGLDGLPVTVAGQIDRLAMKDNTVFIVDFKTGKDVPENAAQVPVAYIRQLEAYRALIRKIYPNKTIKCGIIWTSVPALILLENKAGA